MKRLDTKTLPAFLASSGLAVMLVSTEDTLLDTHAYDFARLWAACVESGRDDIRFGYVDASGTPAARKLACGSPLPVILLIHDGQVACRSIRGQTDEAALNLPGVWPNTSRPMALAA